MDGVVVLGHAGLLCFQQMRGRVQMVQLEDSYSCSCLMPSLKVSGTFQDEYVVMAIGWTMDN